MKRTYIQDIKVGQSVLLKAWVFELRSLAKMEFLLLRDSSGIVQGIIKDVNLLKRVSELTLESVVEIKGKVKKANVKAELVRSDVEVEILEFEVLSKAEKLPIQVNEKTTTTSLSNKLDYRYLDLRKLKIKAIFKIQSEIAHCFRKFFYDKDFMEVQLPSIISSSSEGGTELFSVNYFEKKAYLAQSPQLYKQMLACSVENVFTITPVWRAEKHNTIRHLNESRQMDIEMAFSGQMEVMKELELVVKYIVKEVLKKCKEELDLLKIKLKVPKAKYISYDETVKLLEVKYGEDLTPENEKKLDEKFPDTIVFVHSWPASLKPFYIMPKKFAMSPASARPFESRPNNVRASSKNSELSEGFDAIYKGMEISSGGQRIHVPDLLIEKLKSKKLNPKNFKDYIDSFRFGAPEHAGWSIGLERLTQLITGQKNIREVVLFPRDRERLTP
ncbi:aspartate--tRNA(Asn) ligase [Candidatus Pacearchaeota archaeon]|nr:aspartate--tRNA(Asn) ligase [Candidatus Pacearchaeota archaeon]